jgi:DNA-damage-inducible protein J
MKTAVIHARIDPQVKKQAEEVLKSLGINPTDAINIFYRQITFRRGLPFAVSIPNKKTTATLAKSRRGEEVEAFDTLDDLFESWEK